MYQCNLNIIVVSERPVIEAALNAAELPEDCQISVGTLPALTEKQEKLDTAVIFDGPAAYAAGAGLIGGRTLRILAAECGTLNNISGLPFKPDDLWVLPADCDKDALPQFYAEKLILRMKESFDYRLQTICFNTAVDSIPDLAWFKDVKGAHLIVNNSFCEAVDKTKQQIYKKGHYYIWDIAKEEYDQGDYVCLESEEVVMKARETCLFDEKVKTKNGMRQFKTYKSPLIDEDGIIFGTCGIANDVTAQHNINSELEVILDSMPFAVVIDDENEDVLAVNRLFNKYFPEYSGIVGTNIATWKNKVMHGKLEDNEIVVETESGMIIINCSVKPIYSIFDEIIGNAIILTDVTNERKRFEQTIHNANTDFLTGLYNRRRLFEYFDGIKYSSHISTVMVDLDNFKGINDTYGHKAGDDALVETANILRKCFPGDFISRLGGDEFLIIINREISVEALKEQAETLLATLRQAFSEKSEFVILGASVGVAVSSVPEGEAHDFEALLKHSDDAMYQAKNTGKNKVCICGG